MVGIELSPYLMRREFVEQLYHILIFFIGFGCTIGVIFVIYFLDETSGTCLDKVGLDNTREIERLKDSHFSSSLATDSRP